ncbi:MAG: M6 family metalloprotease domain-containing protein [Bacteroidales bacterium]|nr:M6 family metalloprotease domain-containing protein [Bacteroidales bacterium]
MKRTTLLMLAAGICISAAAIPAKPGKVVYTQPDGTEIELLLVGDEHGHLAYTSDGLLVVDNGGRLEYAGFDRLGRAVASGRQVTAKALTATEASALQPASRLEQWRDMVLANRDTRISLFNSKMRRLAEGEAGEGSGDEAEGDTPEGNPGDNENLDEGASGGDEGETGGGDEGEEQPDGRVVPLNFGRCESTFPVLGEQKGLVVLVEYEDIAFTYGDYDYFNRMLNEEGFSDFGSLGSCRDWFVDNSGGLFMPDFDVYGPVVLPNKRNYYGANDFFGNDMRPHEMAIHALEILDEEVDFSQYDRDGDGKIDNVFIFYAGRGEHDSNLANAVWPHSWDISIANPDSTYVFDDVVLDHYACTCEYPSGYKRPDGIGTFVHEFSHVMGLPDLYVTTYTGGFTPGPYSVLDQGPYNNDRLTPPNYSSYEKCALGWVDMIPIEEGTVELPNFSDSNIAYVLPTERPDEFYFFENRQQKGNDTYLPNHGMLVWRVDYNKTKWDMNSVNNTSSHQGVDLVEADNRKTEGTREGDPYPGASGNTELTFDSKPKLCSWSNKPLAFDIKNIEETEDGLIRFDAIARVENPGPGDDLNVAVEVVEEAGSERVVYDLMGRKVLNPTRGIYVVNGRKVVIGN